MAGVHGERLYGYVDHVPGLCYVATRFFHFNFVPIVPLGTYLLMEGSETKAGMQGRRIAMNLKSVLLGYFRGWVGLATIVLFAICAFQSTEVVLANERDDLIRVAVFGLAAVAYAATWWAMLGTHKSWMLAWILVLAASGGYFAWESHHPAPPKPANPFKVPQPRGQKDRDDLPILLLSANGCLLALSTLRVFDRAGRNRAYELGETLGLDDETMDAIWERISGQSDPTLSTETGD